MRDRRRNSTRLHPLQDLTRSLQTVPEGAGVYLFFFRGGRALLRRAGLIRPHPMLLRTGAGADLMYIGMSADAVRRRVKTHLTGDSCASSLRQTLGILLMQELGLTPEPIPLTSRFHFGEGERRLTDWMVDRGFVLVIGSHVPESDEARLIRVLEPPLNITGRRRSPGARHLLVLRNRYSGRGLTRPDRGRR